MWESVMAISTDVGILPERLTLHDFGSAEFAGGVEALFEPPPSFRWSPNRQAARRGTVFLHHAALSSIPSEASQPM